MVSQLNSSGNISPRFTTLQLSHKVQEIPLRLGWRSKDNKRECETNAQLVSRDLLSSMGQTPESFTGRILFMSMFNDISCDRKGNQEECLANAGVVKVLARRFGVGQWSFIGPGSEKKWYPSENSPQGAWDHVAEDMLLKFAESGCPIFHATIVQRSTQKQRTWKPVDTLCSRFAND